MANHNHRGRYYAPQHAFMAPTARQRAALPPRGMAGGSGFMGQTANFPSNGASCPPPAPSCPQPGYNVVDNPSSCQGPMCERLPPICGASVIGFNTLTTNLLGVAPGATVTIPVTAGDACGYQARALFLAAFEADANTNSRLASPLVQLPFILINVRVGSVPQIRRAGQLQFGILSDAYSDQKELTPVDFARFTSVQQQGLEFDVQAITNESVHIFGVVWGDVG